MASREEVERFIDALKADETLREEVERAILDARLLAVPEQLGQLIEAVGDLTAVTTAHTGRLDSIDSRLDGIDSRLDSLEGHVGHLDGREYERRAATNAPSILARVGLGLRRIRVVAKSDLADCLDDAIDDAKIAQDERDDAILADIVATARRRDDSETVWLVAEVSTTLHEDDVTRALRRSSAIATALGVGSVAVGVCDTVEPGLDTEGIVVVVYRNAEAA